jgi:LPS sulfotransferase NodH
MLAVVIIVALALAVTLYRGGRGTTVVTRTGEAQGHTPLVILKLPRSGSSWVTEELNEIPTVFISKEIVQHGDRSAFGVSDMEQHLARALQRPTGKLSSVGDFLPTGRFFEDYLLHKSMKPLQTLRVLGFTVNPEHCKDVQWRRIQEAVPQLRMVALVRSNVIKSALSGYRGKQTQALCGSANLRISTLNNCTLPATVDWTLVEFTREVTAWQDRYDEFAKVIRQISALERVAVTPVYYEDMQLNMENTFTFLFKSIGIPEDEAIALSKSKVATPAQTGWLKRTSDDLRVILPRFAEIELALERGHCVCLLEQLRSTKAKVFPPCTERFDEITGECRRSIEGG